MSFDLAIIGPTASGKSSLAIEVAKELKGIILSLDSLSIYKEIDIASAKPSKEEQKEAPHFGIDLIYPNQPFSVVDFINLYQDVKSKNLDKPLIITGGSSFYLKMLLDGVSPMPKLSLEVKDKAKEYLRDIDRAYEFLKSIDPEYKINKNDRYRLQKALEIYFATNQTPSEYFFNNPPAPIIKDILIFEIAWSREVLRERIKKRTYQMRKRGLVDEVAFLEAKYQDRTLTPLKAIGVREVLDYFDGRLSKDKMIEKIITNTANLAKRQTTFNQSQFKNQQLIRGDLKSLKKEILSRALSL